jgi:hypothetical protein
VHFGLGAGAAPGPLEIRWPSGVRQVVKDVQTDRILQVDEPAQ